MLQPIRRSLAALAMAAALLLVVPAPSWAAQARKPAPDHTLGLVAQVWSWLESLLGDSRPSAAPRKTVIAPPPPAPLPPPPEQGPMIDPDGVK